MRKLAPNELPDASAPLPQADTRADGWLNAIVGFGGGKDKTSATVFDPVYARLMDPQLSSMFATEDLSAKIVNMYPQQALREGWKLTGFAPETEAAVDEFLEPYDPEQEAFKGAVWGRLYGGAATWFGNKDDPAQPFKLGDPVDFLRTIDRRFLFPWQAPDTLDVQGMPTIYQVRTAQGVVIGNVHASRLVLWPGEMTDELTKQGLGHWDLSVLQRPLNALRSDGTVWKAAEYLMTEASVGIFSIKNLTSLVGAGQKAALQMRLTLLNLGRSFAKAMTLDKDSEDYRREAVQFAGIPDLTDRALKRVASAANIPVSVLLGEAPAGLNATGDNDLRWFLMQVQSYRLHVMQCRVLRIARVLLAQPGSPVRQIAPKIGIMWPDLWTRPAAEAADIYLKYSQGDVNYITSQTALPEEIALSRFGVSGWSGQTTIKRDLREEALKTAELPSEAEPTPDVTPGNAGGSGTNPRGNPGPAVPEPPKQDRADHILKTAEGYEVVSEDGSKKFGTYKSKAEAQKRLAEVEKLQQVIHPRTASLLYRQLGRTPPKPGATREAPPRSRLQSAGYAQRLQAVVKQWYDHVETIGRRELGARADASFDEQLSAAFDKLVQAAGLDAFLERKAKSIFGKQTAYVKRVTRLPPGQVGAQLPAIEAFRQENAKLITGLKDDQVDRVAGVLREAQSRGQRWEDTAPDIKDALGVGMDRARLIARDQTNKFNGSMMEVTQTNAGIEEYTWSTTKAPSCRGTPGGPNTRKGGHNHYVLEGTRQRWDSPPVVGPDGDRFHPGKDINCECVAIPVIPAFE